jgi:hypothetical protein
MYRNVPDKTRTGAAKIEGEKSELLDFYIAEINQRQFYGEFFSYGC